MMTKNSIILTTLLFLISCSTGLELREISGFKRVQIDQQNYGEPQFFISMMSLNRGRQIASVSNESISDESQESARGLSNRQIYFLNSYIQYKAFNKMISQKEIINSCPSFHNVLLDNEKLIESVSENYSLKVSFNDVRKEETNIPFYPVLALPYDGSHDLFSTLVNRNWKNSEELTRDAVAMYAQKKEAEVAQLCDKGVSPGYYIFENLATYFNQNHGSQSNQLELEALLKVPMMASMIILDNLEKNEFVFQSNKFEALAITRVNAHWFHGFRNSLKEKRKNYLSLNTLE